MKLLITIPAFGLHGGLQIITQWANRLTQWHDVYLYNLSGNHNTTWMKVSDKVKLCGPEMIWQADCVILTSPHSAHILDLILPGQKCFLFLQMCEDMFRPHDINWLQQCKKFYQADRPMFLISGWNKLRLANLFGRQKIFRCSNTVTNIMSLPAIEETPDFTTFYISNGIDLEQFPISKAPKDGKILLVEGWEAGNPTKDTDAIGPKVAERLRNEGYYIIAYGGAPIKTLRHVPHEYHRQPDLKKLNELYTRATILIKATKYDARSTSPVEAMCKGTVTARAIIEGDDDLIDEVNCLRSGYDMEALYQSAKTLLTDAPLRQTLANNGFNHIKENCDWDKIMNHVNSIITHD